MDTLLGVDPPAARQYWGYLRGDGTTILKPYRGREQLDATQNEPGVKHVRGPFIAVTWLDAWTKLKGKIQTAQVNEAQRRREAATPS